MFLLGQFLAPAVLNGLAQMQDQATKDAGGQLAAAALGTMAH